MLVFKRVSESFMAGMLRRKTIRVNCFGVYTSLQSVIRSLEGRIQNSPKVMMNLGEALPTLVNFALASVY